MVTQFVIGSGNSRVVIPASHRKDERRSAAAALKRHLFPTKAAHNRAMAAGRRRREAIARGEA